ncbi:phage tail protein [Pantoea anthophila]|uniref:phage tail protein n=1 Tax=Pantoea anthophila TaxID=470931 RepID=UPI002DBAE3CA|nr:phage tail protein [Pantoea anthophila]MEB6222826.1 phage tail protein [Pantoea anthophila]
MTTKYFALLTNQGAAKLANAAALGTKVNITSMGVGDGGGTLPAPDAAQTKLIGEKRRAQLNSLTVDAANSSQIIAEQIIPESEGGFWIREIGLYDADGVLIAVANCPETYKPQLAEGSGRTQTVRMILIVNSTAAVTLKIDPSVVLATRQYVDNATIEVKAYADDLMAKHIAAADPHKQYAPKESPVFTGTPKAPTPAAGNSSTLLATTAFVQAAIAQLVASSPEALDTLNELAAALGNDPNFATTMMNQLAARALLAGSVNQQFFVKDPTQDGHAVTLGKMNTELGKKAASEGSQYQKFLVKGVTDDSNAAAAMWQLTQGLAGRAAYNGSEWQVFDVGPATYKTQAVRLDQFQSGNNGNGAWTKFPGSAQYCRQNMTVPAKSSLTWTFPIAFISAPAMFMATINGAPNVWCAGIGASSAIIYNNNDSAVNVNALAIW